MIKSTVSNKFIKTSVLLAFSLLALGLSGKANTADNVTAKDLTVSTSYSAGLPTASSDVVFPLGTATGTYTVSGGTALNYGTLNDLATSGIITINSGTVTGANTITLYGGTNSVSPSTTTSANDLLYVAAGGGLTIANGTNGGTLGLVLASSGNFDSASTATNGGITISSVISGTGDIHKTGNGTITLSGANTFVGNFYVDNTGTGTVTVGASTGALGTGILYLGDDSSANAAEVNASGTQNLSNSSIVVGNGTGLRELRAGTGGNLNYNGNITLDSGATLILNSGTNAVNGGITLGSASSVNAASISGAGTGNLVLSNSSTGRPGFITINDLVNNAGTITNGGGTVSSVNVVNIAGTIGSAVTSLSQNTLAGTNSVASVMTLSGTNSFTGPITIGTNSTIAITGSGSLGNNGSIVSNVFTAGSTNNQTGAITNNGTFTYGSSATQTISGVISGAGVVNSTGTGTLALTGANTYSGATTISNGVVQAGSATALGTGNVTVNGPFATLQGTAPVVNLASSFSLVNGALQVSAQGSATPGKFTLSGSSQSFALNGIGSWDLNIQGANSDQVVSTGTGNTFSISGTTLDLTGDNLEAGQYIILSGFASGTGTFSPSILGYNTSMYTVTFDDTSVAGEGILDVVANGGTVPEPSTWAMLLGGVALLVTIQRRRAGRA